MKTRTCRAIIYVWCIYPLHILYSDKLKKNKKKKTNLFTRSFPYDTLHYIFQHRRHDLEPDFLLLFTLPYPAQILVIFQSYASSYQYSIQAEAFKVIYFLFILFFCTIVLYLPYFSSRRTSKAIIPTIAIFPFHFFLFKQVQVRQSNTNWYMYKAPRPFFPFRHKFPLVIVEVSQIIVVQAAAAGNTSVPSILLISK